MWNEIKPFRLKPRDHGSWLFAVYTEFPSERDDDQWYSAFLFRNKEGTIFGIREWTGKLLHRKIMRHMATRVAQDATYRRSLISDDPSLPKMWRGR